MRKKYAWVIVLFAVSVLVALSLAEAGNYEYNSRGRRDPFLPLLGSERVTASMLQDVTAIEDVKLEGIASGSQGNLIAILDGQMVKQGEKFGIVEIKEITKNSVRLLIGGKEYKLVLPEEGK